MDVKGAKEKLEEKKKLLYVKPKNIEFEPRRKAKAKGGDSVKQAQVKQGVKEERIRQFVKDQALAERNERRKSSKRSKADADEEEVEAEGQRRGDGEGDVEETFVPLEQFDPLARFKPRPKKQKPET